MAAIVGSHSFKHLRAPAVPPPPLPALQPLERRRGLATLPGQVTVPLLSFAF